MKLHRIFFLVFLLLLPTQLSLHFWPLWSFIGGIRVDYLSPTIYLSDLVLFFVFLCSRRFINIKKYWPFLLLVAINVLFSLTPLLAILRWLKVMEVLFLIFYVKEEYVLIRKYLPFILTFELIVIFILSVAQFLSGHTIGWPFYWLGERQFSITTPSIALGSFLGQIFLRPYAFFPHPNVLAGFTLVSALLIFYFSGSRKIKIVSFLISLILILISYSQALWLSIFVIFLFILFKLKVKYLFYLSILFSLLSPLLASFYSNDFLNLGQSELLRAELSTAAGYLFARFPFFGVGLGNFIVGANKFVYPGTTLLGTLPIFRLQPVHNLFLLILTETGALGLGFVILYLKKLLSLKFPQLLGMALVVVFVTGSFDHYWITTQQGLMLLCLLVGIILGLNVKIQRS